MKQFRIFRNHYLCPDCPNEWSDEMMVVGPSYCPCCDAEAGPYDTDSLLEEVHGVHIAVEEDNTGYAPAAERFSAIDDDTYDGLGSPRGTGPTPEAAVADLMEQLEAV